MINHLLDCHVMDIEADNEDLRSSMPQAYDFATPLRCAIYHKNFAAVLKLFEKGAKPEHDAIVKAIGYIFFEAFSPALAHF